MRQASTQHERDDETNTPHRQEPLPSMNPTHLEESSFGVQSLEDTLAEAFGQQSSHASDSNTSSPQKRKNGRRIHPKIAAAAQRIISSDHSSSRSSSISSSASPRSISTTSRDVPSTSLKPSGMFASPRPGSVRSLALSDDDGSVFDDCGSQAIHSSSEDDDLQTDDPPVMCDEARISPDYSRSVPQLVMPSLSMPKRRPFTDRGKQMGRLKVLIMGPSGTGKTCLLRSILHACEDVVHVEPSSTHWRPEVRRTERITEIHASTKPLPSWWSDFDEDIKQSRRRSIGGPILDRNLCFVDTPGWTNNGASDDEHMQVVVDDVVAHLEACLGRNMSLSQMGDSELLSCLCGAGGLQVDLILYVIRPCKLFGQRLLCHVD